MKGVLIALAAALTGCTAGAVAPAGGAATAALLTIDVNLTQHGAAATATGTGGGYAPLESTVAVGTTLRFVNSDGFAHTATSLPGQTFPAASPLGNAALSSFGTKLSGGLSTGSLGPGASSQTVFADQPGTFLYGCFYHYGAPMRGTIVVR